MSDVTIIFTHFGYSSYLEYSLACAKKTNPNARLILLGDEYNRDVAIKNGWEHYLFERYPSSLQSRFLKVFKHIQGVKHNPIKNGKDWLRYVFERWFFIDGFIKAESIERFWHFDSDTMILKDLQAYQQDLQWADFSVQCNNTCLNGIVSSIVTNEYCEHICSLFEDADYINSQYHEFDTINKNWAFTEIRAFDDYKKSTLRPWVHLLTYRDNEVFDDCICQEHGFKMSTLPSGEVVKALTFSQGNVYGLRDGLQIEFVTLNLSWVPDYVFKWSLDGLGATISDLQQASCPIKLIIYGYLRKLKKLIKNAIV